MSERTYWLIERVRDAAAKRAETVAKNPRGYKFEELTEHLDERTDELVKHIERLERLATLAGELAVAVKSAREAKAECVVDDSRENYEKWAACVDRVDSATAKIEAERKDASQ